MIGCVVRICIPSHLHTYALFGMYVHVRIRACACTYAHTCGWHVCQPSTIYFHSFIEMCRCFQICRYCLFVCLCLCLLCVRDISMCVCVCVCCAWCRHTVHRHAHTLSLCLFYISSCLQKNGGKFPSVTCIYVWDMSRRVRFCSTSTFVWFCVYVHGYVRAPARAYVLVCVRAHVCTHRCLAKHKF